MNKQLRQIKKVIQEQTIQTTKRYYLNPQVTANWKQMIIQHLNNLNPLKANALNNHFGVDIKGDSIFKAKLKVITIDSVNLIGVGYTAKAAYEDGVQFVKNHLKREGVILNKKQTIFKVTYGQRTFIQIN